MVSIVMALLLACGGGKDDTSGGDPADDTAGGGADPDVAPEVLSVERAVCTQQQSAGEVWDVQLAVDDPQGAATVRGGSFDVLNAQGGVLASAQALACGNGQCFGSMRADTTGVTCAVEATFRFVVTDTDGNTSAPFSHTP
jgi:hypothetical protein